MPDSAHQCCRNDSPVNDGNYIHPIPLQMLVAAKGVWGGEGRAGTIVWFEAYSVLGVIGRGGRGVDM